MVKNFNEFIEENYTNPVESSKDAPDCLLKIVQYLNTVSFQTSKERDGRVGSIKDEDDCIELLKKSTDFDVFEDKDYTINPDRISCIIPKIREWFDIEVVYNNKHYYVNIKSSNLKTFDNVGSSSAILFGLFGKKVSLKNKTKADQYAELFFEYNKCEENGYDNINDIDYYFLVINKNKTNNVFITSLNHINKDSIKSNGSNLPFQCNWSKNSLEIKLSKSKICDIVIETIFNSLIKSIDFFEKEPIKIYMDKHNKKVNTPTLWENKENDL